MVYEYKCRSCGNVMEIEQKLSEDPLEECYCQVCGSVQHVSKLISAPLFILKGGGWAKDGYSGSNKSK